LVGKFAADTYNSLFTVNTESPYWFYTFTKTVNEEQGQYADVSVTPIVITNMLVKKKSFGKGNVIKSSYFNDLLIINKDSMCLPNNVFYSTDYAPIYNYIDSYSKSNTFDNNCQGNLFGQGLTYNTFGENIKMNDIGTEFTGNAVGDNFLSNKVGKSVIGLCVCDNFEFNTLANALEYLNILNSSTGTVKNYILLNAIKGTGEHRLDVTLDPNVETTTFIPPV
jgi:hypothetical protein